MEKIQVSLKSDKSKGTIHEDVYVYDNISLSSSENEKFFRRKL